MIKNCSLPSIPEDTHIPLIEQDGKTCRKENVVEMFSKTRDEVKTENVVKFYSKGLSNCLLYSDLLVDIKNQASEIISDFSNDKIKYFTNMGLETLWNFNNPINWNWTLKDFEIVLDGDCARYRLPDDFYGISGVSFTDTKHGKIPSKGYFTVIPSHMWDSVQFGNYVMYTSEEDGYYLWVRDRSMHEWMSCGCPLIGSVFVKYYTSPPRVTDLDSKVCGLPWEWGARSILIDLIVGSMYESKGKQYPNQSNLNMLLGRLKKLDSGEQIRDNIYKNKPVKFSIIR